MDEKTHISTLGEIRVAQEFIRDGWSVFLQFSGKEPFDLVAVKNQKTYRVSVKSVLKIGKNKSYTVQLRRIRSNKTKNTIHLFDNKSCDILAVYLHDINEVVFVESSSIKRVATITFRHERTNKSKTGFLIKESNLQRVGRVVYCASLEN